MRTSPAHILLVIAFCLVIVVELRTVLAFFDLELSVVGAAVLALVVIVAVLVWAVYPPGEDPER